MNRDFFAKPLQGNGRDAHHYGHTHLGVNDMRKVYKYDDFGRHTPAPWYVQVWFAISRLFV